MKEPLVPRLPTGELVCLDLPHLIRCQYRHSGTHHITLWRGVNRHFPTESIGTEYMGLRITTVPSESSGILTTIVCASAYWQR